MARRGSPPGPGEPGPVARGFAQAVAELGSIGRNINQIARIAHQSGRAMGPEHQELVALLKVCEGLRDHVKALIRSNVTSWETGYAAPARG